MRIYIHIYPSPDREVTSDSDRVWNHVIGPDFRSRNRIGTSLLIMVSKCMSWIYLHGFLSGNPMVKSLLVRLDAILNLIWMKTRLWQIDLQFYNNLHCIKDLQNCFIEFLSTDLFLLFIRKMFYCLNNQHVVKEKYSLLNTLNFCLSQPHFHSCQTLNMALPWLRSIRWELVLICCRDCALSLW